MPEREPIAGLVYMRVVNEKAPHIGECGKVVDILSDVDHLTEGMVVFELEFASGGAMTSVNLKW